MTSKNKLLLILIIVFSAICIAFATTLIVSSVKLDYAQEHYNSNRHSIKEVDGYIQNKINGYFDQSYGCGDNDCEYCNGVKIIDKYTDFVYYKTHKSLKTASIVILSTFGTLLVASCVYLVIVNKKQ